MGAGVAVVAACNGGDEEPPDEVPGTTPTGAAGGPVHGGRHLTATTMDWGKLERIGRI